MAKMLENETAPSDVSVGAYRDVPTICLLGGCQPASALSVQNHHFSDTRAEHLFGLFTGIAFVLPVLGGWIADKMNYRFPV